MSENRKIPASLWKLATTKVGVDIVKANMNVDSFGWNSESLIDVLWTSYYEVYKDIEDDPEALVKLMKLRDLVPAAIEMISDVRVQQRLHLSHVAGNAVMKFKGMKGGRYYPGYHEDMRDFVQKSVKGVDL